MTVIAAVMARSYSPDMFADLELWPTREYDKPSGVTTLTFPGTLSAPTIATIRARMTSRNDDDMAARAEIADLLATDTTASPLSKRIAAWLLGDA